MTFAGGLILGLWLGGLLCALFILFVIGAVAHDGRAREEQRDRSSPSRDMETPSVSRSSAPTLADFDALMHHIASATAVQAKVRQVLVRRSRTFITPHIGAN